ncbi:hypothetical protein DPMN_165696 [Dreissena polymorpha]|uniref:Uncharacterized protein n=1 Tax=Dreissena polymorpha TaxID=45954 RepID=A0A9D4EVT5_DREPO|nr:hypothetical protein DPMN_165696 [Dreissena polymorpha]
MLKQLNNICRAVYMNSCSVTIWYPASIQPPFQLLNKLHKLCPITLWYPAFIQPPFWLKAITS